MSVTNSLSFSFACFLLCKLTNDSPSLESRIVRDRSSWVAYLMEAWIGSVQVGTGGSIGLGGRMVVVVVWFSRAAGSGGWRLVVGLVGLGGSSSVQHRSMVSCDDVCMIVSLLFVV